jgi:UDP-glucose 4-epimerase
MKVLITGSSGSFGALIAKSLIDKKIQVVGLDIRGPYGNDPGEYFRFYKCSITEKESLKSIFMEEKPDRVLHFACTFNRVRNLQREYEIDVEGSRNILEISDETPSVKQLIFSSSALAYGGHMDNPEWLKEDDPLRPGKLRYGLNKKIIEEIYLNSSVRDDLKISLIRVCTVVGPDFGKPASVVYILLKWSWLPEFCRENKLQFLHTEDFIALIDLMIHDDQITGIYNIATDTYSVVKDLLPDKNYFKFPVIVVKGLLSVLYNLRILNLQPSGINNSVYSILLDPEKIVTRYNYKFRFTSNEAFATAGINNSINLRENLKQE